MDREAKERQWEWLVLGEVDWGKRGLRDGQEKRKLEETLREGCVLGKMERGGKNGGRCDRKLRQTGERGDIIIENVLGTLQERRGVTYRKCLMIYAALETVDHTLSSLCSRLQ